MTLCIIGTSHVGAIKRYISDTEPDYDIDFFAGTSSTFNRSRFFVDGETLYSDSNLLNKMFTYTSRNRTSSVSLKEYSAFALIGEPVKRLHKLISYCGCYGFYDPSVHRHVLSKTSFRDYLIELINRPPGGDLVKALLSGRKDDAPIYICATPMLTRNQLQPTIHRVPPPNNKLEMSKFVNQIISEYFHELGAIYLPQPYETLGPDGLTLPHLEFDSGHLNSEYGEIVIRQIEQSARLR